MAKLLLLSPMSYWSGNSCNLVIANTPTQKMTLFSSESLINSPPVHPWFFLQENVFPFCVFLSRANSLCPPLAHSPHDWTAERLFWWIKRILRTWANDSPTGSTKRRAPPVPPDSPHTYTQAQRAKAVSDTRTNRDILCAAQCRQREPFVHGTMRHLLQGRQMLQQPLLQPQSCGMGFGFLWFPPGLICCC